MKGKRLQLIFVFVLLISLLSPAPIVALPANTSVTPPKIQDYLLALAATDPDEMVVVIVQTEGESAAVEALVAANDGEVTKTLSLINAFAARLPARAVAALAASPAVKWVSLDAPVATTNNTGLTIADDFVDMTYNGSTGTYAWTTDWQETGEADGAALGDVAVTPFWGGALQGLRLQGASKGAQRQLNLADATTANLHLSYRRKGFESEADFVVIELSSDGGVQWQEVGRLAGPVTDAEIQYAGYDISAYRSTTATIRLTTSAGFSEQARFYLDTISVNLTLDASSQPVAANRLYLPLVAGKPDREAATDVVEASLSKAEMIARAGDNARTTCGYHCIDLANLQSTFVKAIRTDQLWNVSPYRRGWGVTVAVVDSGIANHPDFNDYAGNSRLLQQVNFVPGSNMPDDYYGHGTHIAGTIAGLGQSSNRVYMGVAPEAKLVDVRVMNDRGHGNTSNVVEGLQWIYNNRANYNIKVVNLSLNSRIPESYHKSALNAALEVLWFNKIVVVVSAGNGGKQRLYPPANDPFVITVGAVDDKGTAAITDDTLSPFSAYGMTTDGFLKPDLVAPGSNIIGALASDDSNLIVANPNHVVIAPNNSRYFKMSGTSMAAAVVAGAVAVLLEDENLTPDQVKYRLRATARNFSGPESCSAGAGYLDLYAAVTGTTTQSANTGIAASQQLWSGTQPITWGSVSWNSVSWNSVSWNSVSWNSVSWNSVSWNSVSWNSNDHDGGLSSGSCGSAIAGLTLVNADTDQDIQPLYDGAVVNLDAIGTTNLTVRADVVGNVASVKFTLSGSSATTKIENGAPYALAGDTNGNYAPYPLGTGVYTLHAQSYTGSNAGGAAGGAMNIAFTIAGANRCNLESIVRSQPNTRSASLLINNNSSESLRLFWLNYNGVRQSYGTLAPGQTTVLTYATHPWFIARAADNACLHLVPDPANEPEISYPLSSASSGFQGNYLLKAVHSNKCADVDSGSTSNGAIVLQYSCHGGNNQIWTVTPTTDGAYTLKALHSGKCMEVANASTANGANIRQNSCNGNANQKWRIEAVGGDAYKLVAVHSGQVLKVWNGSTMDGVMIGQWPYYGAAYQHWLLQPTN